MITQVLESSAVWGVLLTLAAFGLGVLINKHTGKAILNPLLLGTAFVIVVLSVLNIPYDGSCCANIWQPLWPVCWPELWPVCSACWHWPCCWT